MGPTHTLTKTHTHNFKVVLVMFQAVLHIWSPGYKPRVRKTLYFVYHSISPKIRNVCTKNWFPCLIQSARMGYCKILSKAVILFLPIMCNNTKKDRCCTCRSKKTSIYKLEYWHVGDLWDVWNLMRRIFYKFSLFWTSKTIVTLSYLFRNYPLQALEYCDWRLFYV